MRYTLKLDGYKYCLQQTQNTILMLQYSRELYTHTVPLYPNLVW